MFAARSPTLVWAKTKASSRRRRRRTISFVVWAPNQIFLSATTTTARNNKTKTSGTSPPSSLLFPFVFFPSLFFFCFCFCFYVGTPYTTTASGGQLPYKFGTQSATGGKEKEHADASTWWHAGAVFFILEKKTIFRTFFIFFLNIKTFQLGSDAEIRLLQDLERKSPAQPLAIWTNEWKRALKRTGRVPPPYYISEFNKRLFVYCGWGAFPVHVFVVQHKKTVHLVLGTTFFVLYQKFRNVLLKAQKLVCFFFFNLDSSSQITGFVKMSVRYVCRRFVE